MAKRVYDILTDEVTHELKTAGGDFVTGESTQQHQVALLLDGYGDYKDNPTAPVNVQMYIDNDNKGELLQAISKSYIADGQQDVKVGYVNGKLLINGTY